MVKNYDPDLAYAMVQYADLANLSDQEEILRRIKAIDPEFESVCFFDYEGTQCYVARHPAYIAIAFRGSDEDVDWENNFDHNFVPYRNLGQAHDGFKQAFDVIWNRVVNHIVEDILVDRESQQLLITGHSLGGALATLASIEVLHGIPHLGKLKATYTFGQPRAVDSYLAHYFNIQAKDRFFQAEHNNDIVPQIPPHFLGYRHLGQKIYIDRHRKVRLKQGWWFRLIDRVCGLWEGVTQEGLDPLRDHAIAHYREAFRQEATED